MSAEVGGGEKRGKKGKKRTKKMNPRIDMTPMVDLGFLLLTFFVLTTTLATPTAMPIIIPAKVDNNDPPPDKIASSKVITLLVGEKDRIYWYQGTENPEMQLNDFTNIRHTIFEKRKICEQKFPNQKDPFIVIIKITDKANYKNVVDILDEMTITSQKKYALVEPTAVEIEMLEKYRVAAGLSL